jgi:hypothetical protein
MLIWAVTSIFVVPTTNVRKLIVFELVPRAPKRYGGQGKTGPPTVKHPPVR